MCIPLSLTCQVRHYGAEVIKVEPPNVGDPLRVWRERDVDGVSPWWRSIARNKKSVTIDMRKEEGRRSVPSFPFPLPGPPRPQHCNSIPRLVKTLAVKSDVILENFKPGSKYQKSSPYPIYYLTGFLISILHKIQHYAIFL